MSFCLHTNGILRAKTGLVKLIIFWFHLGLLQVPVVGNLWTTIKKMLLGTVMFKKYSLFINLSSTNNKNEGVAESVSKRGAVLEGLLHLFH